MHRPLSNAEYARPIFGSSYRGAEIQTPHPPIDICGPQAHDIFPASHVAASTDACLLANRTTFVARYTGDLGHFIFRENEPASTTVNLVEICAVLRRKSFSGHTHVGGTSMAGFSSVAIKV